MARKNHMFTSPNMVEPILLVNGRRLLTELRLIPLHERTKEYDRKRKEIEEAIERIETNMNLLNN